MTANPDLSTLAIVTPHSSGAVPDDILQQMMGEDYAEASKRAAHLQRLFLDGDPYTDLLYAAPGARVLHAEYSRFVVDLNRERDDADDNGVIKLLDFDRQPLYPAGFTLNAKQREQRLKRIWDSFETQLEELISGAKLLIVGHSMAPHGPKLGPDTGAVRPAICLMLGSDEQPTFPKEKWNALLEACQAAFGPALPRELDQIAIGIPWDTDTISAAQSTKQGIPAFGIELNSSLFMEPVAQGGAPKDEQIQALNAAFVDFAGRALALVE